MVLSLPPPSSFPFRAQCNSDGTRFSRAPPLPGSWLALSTHVCYLQLLKRSVISSLVGQNSPTGHIRIIPSMVVVLFLPSDGQVSTIITALQHSHRPGRFSFPGPNRSHRCPGSCAPSIIHYARGRLIRSCLACRLSLPTSKNCKLCLHTSMLVRT
jgi:hypothetical protein